MAYSQDDRHRRQTLNTSSWGVVKRAPRTNARAWRDAEEEYLLRERGRATPYKLIAAQLHKTELACRLHYHQMTFGAHRRQSKLAVTGSFSEGSHSPHSVRKGTISGHATPAITVSYSPSARTSFSASPTSPASTSTTNHATLGPSIGTDRNSPQLSQKPQSGSSAINGDIGLTREYASLPMPKPPAALQECPDLSRVLHDYAANNRAFWSNVANQYSNLSQSPSELEAAFYAALGQKLSTTAAKSDQRYLAPSDWSYGASEMGHKRAFSAPQESCNSAMHAPSPKRCTVSSLLNCA